MQGEFFSQRRPNFVNYASFGSLVGYVVASVLAPDAFYSRDHHGNSIDWCNNEDSQQLFMNKTRCLMSENGGAISLADLLAAKVAYGAYKEWAKRHSDELELPFLKLHSNQLFWVAIAQNQCVKYRGKIFCLANDFSRLT